MTATVTVSALASAVPGTSTVTVAASGAGVTAVSAPFQLTIAATPSFTLAATPAALNVNAGSGVNTSVSIARVNLPGAVALALDSPPVGITGTFTPVSTSADVSQLTVAVAATVPPGNYTVVIMGTASGATDRTTNVTLTVGAQPNFTLSAAAVTIASGASGASSITLTRTNFTGDVALSLVTPPAGITASFTPATTTGSTSLATVVVAPTVAAGNYSLTVQGAATGPGNKTTTLQVTVTVAADFAIAASPTGISVTAGLSGTSTVTITRTNFGGAVTLALSSAPVGITATFAPNVTLTSSSVATVAVAASVAPGSYDLVVQGAGFNIGARTTALRVTVVAAPTATAVDFAVCNLDLAQLVWAAYRDGNGPWTKVTPTLVNGVQRVMFNITSATAAVAYTIQVPQAAVRNALSAPLSPAAERLAVRSSTNAGRFDLRAFQRDAGAPVIYSTTQVQFLRTEIAQYASCVNVTLGSALTATVSGIPVGDNARVTSVAGGSPFFTSATPTRTLDQPAGAQDFWTVRQNANGTSIFSDLQRGVTVPGTLNVNALTMTPALVATVTLTGLPAGGIVSDEMELTTTRGRIAPVLINGTQPNATRRIVAHSGAQASDMYGYRYAVVGQLGSANQLFSGTYYLGQTVADKTIAVHTAAPAWTTTTVTNTPYTRLRSTGTIPAEYNRLVAVTHQGNGFQANSYTVMATGGWLAAQGSATSYDLSMEDLSAAQWPVGAALAPPATTSRLMLTGSNFGLQPVAGAYAITVIRSLLQ